MTFLSKLEFRGSDGDVELFNVQINQTSKAVSIPFEDALDVIQQAYDATSPVDSSTYTADVKAALESLLQLARDGVVDPEDSLGRTFYLGTDMGTSVNELLDTFRSAGAEVDLDTLTVTLDSNAMQQWWNLSKTTGTITEALNFARAAIIKETEGYLGQQGIKDANGNLIEAYALDDPNRVYSSSLQAFVELIYIKTGNEVFSDKLEELETALDVNKQILDYLSDLQFLHNKVTTQPLAGDSPLEALDDFLPTSTATGVQEAFISLYESLAEARYLDAKIIPVPSDDLFETGLNSKSPALSAALEEIERIYLGLSGLESQLAFLETGSTNPASAPEGGLLANVRNILEDISPIFTGGAVPSDPSGDGRAISATATKFFHWLMDGYNSNTIYDAEKAVSRDITLGITAAQNLNDKQKEDVRRFLLVFEEYYKSASAILTKLTEIIQRMAQGISR